MRGSRKTYWDGPANKKTPFWCRYYNNWCRSILNALLPFLILAFLNGRIIFQLRISNKLSSNRVKNALKSYLKPPCVNAKLAPGSRTAILFNFRNNNIQLSTKTLNNLNQLQSVMTSLTSLNLDFLIDLSASTVQDPMSQTNFRVM